MWRASRTIFVCAALLAPLGGCASLAENALSLPSGILTASTANPVTPGVLYEVENGAAVAFAGLNTYRTSCKNKILADNARRRMGDTIPKENCRAIVAQLQVYTRRIPGLLSQLRKFVRENDQVNAGVVLAQVRGLISQFRTFAATNGVGA
jgi:hypothetical protein